MTVNFGGLLTQVDTAAQYPLGYKVLVPAKSAGTDANKGDAEWVYVFNDEAANAFAAGDIVIRDPSVTTFTRYGVIQAPVTTAAPAHSVVGVAQHAIAAGSYGFVQCKGIGLMRPGTNNITADTQLTSGGQAAGGCLDFADGALGHIVIGFSLIAMATDNTTFEAYIDCAGA